MYIEKVRIVNYRSCKDLELNLNNYSVIVGYNNAGKSNAMSAIQWLINPTVLGKEDFYDSGNDIEVYAVIDGITEEVLKSISPEHAVKISPFIVSQKMMMKRVMDHTALTKRGISWSFSKDIGKEFSQADWVSNPTGIDNAIHKLFPEILLIPAMSDAVEDSTKNVTKTTMGTLFSMIMTEFKKKNETIIEDSLKSIQELVNISSDTKSEDFKRIDELVSSCISEIFPGIRAELHVNMPSIDNLFKEATIKTIEQDTVRDIKSLGCGAQRSIQMALIRTLAEITNQEDRGEVTIILIEEPEIYLHPYAIELTRQSLKKLSKGRFQVIVVTHSPLFISDTDLPDTQIFRKNKERGTYRLPTLREKIIEDCNDLKSQTEILFSLSNKTNILFCEKVLLAEGRTENRLLPKLFEKVNGKSMASYDIALVPQDGVGNTAKCMKIISHLGLTPYAVTDLDYAFRNARNDSLIENNDPDITSLLGILKQLQSQYKFELDQNGLPTRNASFTASQVFEKLAQDTNAEKHINSLHAKLLEKHIWLWTKGSIENHLGIKNKNENAWTNLAQKIEGLPLENAISDPKSIMEFVAWITKQ